MTCRDKMKLEHPEKVSSDYHGGCWGCPHYYDYLDKPDYCPLIHDIVHNNTTCTKCWDREIPETGTGKNPNTKETNGEKEMEEKYKYPHCRATDVDLVLSDRTWFMDKIKYLQDTVIPAIEKEVDKRDKVIAGFKEDAKDLEDTNNALNDMKEGLYATINNQRDIIARKEEILKDFQKQIGKLKLDNEKKADEIRGLSDVIKELEELNMSKQNENVVLKKGFEEEITKLKLDIERKNERIKELIIDNDDLYAVNTALHEEIERSKLVIKGTPLSEVKKEVFNQYCMNDIAITKMYYEESAYIKIARHIRSKYNALVKAGFSHDEAMSFIPMWTDDCEVNNVD